MPCNCLRFSISRDSLSDQLYPNRTIIGKFKESIINYTVTFKIAEWSSGWKITPGYYCLSWTQTWSSNGPTSLSKTYKKGETCTIYWASSSYEPVAIRYSNHNLVEYFSGTSSYSFKVTGNVTYYIEMVEYRPKLLKRTRIGR